MRIHHHTSAYWVGVVLMPLLNCRFQIRTPKSTNQNHSFDVPTKTPTKMKILILGETGVGKSTMINSIANYLRFEDLQSAVDSEEVTFVTHLF